MIQLQCSNCRTLLSIDDAFAGGVCRCQHCGTIQTVPKPGKETVAADSSSPKALFKRKARIESALNPYSDSLDRAADELGSSGNLSANALASVPGANSASAGSSQKAGRSGSFVGSPSGSRSGAAASGSGNGPAAKPHYTPTPSKSAASVAVAPRKSSNMPLIIAAAAGGVVVIGAVVWFVASSSPEKPAEPQTGATIRVTPGSQPPAAATIRPTPSTPAPEAVAAPETPVVVIEPEDTTTPQTPAPAADATHEEIIYLDAPQKAPTISGMSIQGKSVIYIVDRSGCTQQAFAQIAEACLKSAGTLGDGARFQLAVWNNQRDLAYPENALGSASVGEIESARKAIVDTYAGSAGDINDLMTKAMPLRPDAIVLVSAMDIDPATAAKIRDAMANHAVKLYGIAVGTDLKGEQLRQLTTEFGGSFKQLGLSGL